jgi:cytochrome c-type biogenesis protein CcmH
MMFWIAVSLMCLVAIIIVVAPIIKPEIRLQQMLVIALPLVIAFFSIVIYQKLGNPNVNDTNAISMPGQTQMMGNPADLAMNKHPGNNAPNMDLNKMADGLAKKLESNPNNPDGWALLARTYIELKRYEEAVPAFEHASAIVDKDASMLADYADALAVKNKGVFNSQIESIVEKALKLEPSQKKALLLKATIAFNRNDFKSAIDVWKKVDAISDLDAETKKVVEASIEEAKKMMSNPK